MNISENEAHSAIYCSENEYFARRCRHYKAKESKAESLDLPLLTIIENLQSSLLKLDVYNLLFWL